MLQLPIIIRERAREEGEREREREGGRESRDQVDSDRQGLLLPQQRRRRCRMLQLPGLRERCVSRTHRLVTAEG